MNQFKGVLVGAVATALLLASGCESKPGQPQVDSRDTQGSQVNPRSTDVDMQRPVGATQNDSTERGMGGSGTETGGTGVGGTGTGGVQSGSSAPGTDTTSSPQMGGTTGTGTEGSDMGSGGATNSAQGQGTPPR